MCNVCFIMGNKLKPLVTFKHLPAQSIRLLRHKGHRRNYHFQDEGHPGHELLYVDFGKMVLTTEIESFTLETGDCVIVPARKSHHIKGRVGNPFDFLNLVYTGPMPRKLVARVFRLAPKERRIMAAMKCEEGFSLPNSRAMSLAKLNELLILLERRTFADSLDNYPLGENRLRYRNLVVQKALGYLEANLSKPLDSNAIGHYCGVSPSRLRVLLKNETGKTLRQHLRAIRIELACQLLHESYKNIDEICYQVGYQSVPHFCTVFKDEIGMTPTAFARSLGKPDIV